MPLMSKIGITDLKVYLKGLSQADLEREILELYRGFPPIKKYYQAKLGGIPPATQYHDYVTQIEKCVDPRIGGGQPSFQKIRRLLAQARRANCTPTQITEIMLFVVETGLDVVNDWVMPESYYEGIYQMYERACRQIIKKGLQPQYRARCKAIIDICDVGYGLCEMEGVFKQHFP